MTKSQVRATLTIPEAAAICGIGTSLCRRLVASGQIPSIRLGRKVLVLSSGLERMLGHSTSRHSELSVDLTPTAVEDAWEGRAK